MAFWNKKTPKIGEGDENPAEQEVEKVEQDKKSSNLNFEMQIAKMQGQLESLSEMRKSSSERFGLVNEQIGEIRGMITNLSQSFSKIEVTSAKAIDRVDSVQPETFMTSLRKNEGRIEALKANIESNEALMQDIKKELKGIRSKMDFYKGTEQVIKLHEEIKGELADIKKTEALTDRHATSVESMFLDISKKASEFDKFDGAVKDLNRSFQKIQRDFEKVRVQVDLKADKKEFVNLVNKFSDFEKHTSNIIKLLDQRSKQSKDDLNRSVSKMKGEIEKKYDVKIKLEDKSNPESEKKKQEKKKKSFLGLFKKQTAGEDEGAEGDENSEGFGGDESSGGGEESSVTNSNDKSDATS